jgi:hypothetical protein
MISLTTHRHILAAIRDFAAKYPNSNDYDSWLDKGNYRWAIKDGKRYCPCKWPVAKVKGIETPDIHTHEAIRILKGCGFEIVKKP